MIRMTDQRARRGYYLALAAACCTMLALGGPAHAAFPGANGKIAFLSDRDAVANAEIYAMNGDGSEQRALTSSAGREWPAAWSADGKRLVYARSASLGEFPSRYLRQPTSEGLYVMNADGSEVTRLTSDGSDDNPGFSPDGSLVVFERNFGALWTVGSDGTGERELLAPRSPAAPALQSASTPVFSPDGSEVAFAGQADRAGGGRKYEIFVMNADGTNVRQVTDTANGDESYAPDWSPDGGRIAFSRWHYEVSESGSRNRWSDVFTVGADGSDLRRITNAASFENAEAPAYSPDGTKIVYHTYAGEGTITHRQVRVVGVDGSGDRALTSQAANDGYPDWQPIAQEPPQPAGTFTCRASALRTGARGLVREQVGSLLDFEPVVANTSRSPCRSEDEALAKSDTQAQPGATDVQVRVLRSETTSSVRGAEADAYTAGVAVTTHGHTISSKTLRSEAAARCGDGGVQVSSASEVERVIVDGQPIAVGDSHLDIPVGGLLTLHLNHTAEGEGEITQRAFWLEVPQAADVVVSEAIAGAEGDPCS